MLSSLQLGLVLMTMLCCAYDKHSCVSDQRVCHGVQSLPPLSATRADGLGLPGSLLPPPCCRCCISWAYCQCVWSRECVNYLWSKWVMKVLGFNVGQSSQCTMIQEITENIVEELNFFLESPLMTRISLQLFSCSLCNQAELRWVLEKVLSSPPLIIL